MKRLTPPATCGPPAVSMVAFAAMSLKNLARAADPPDRAVPS